MTFISIYVYYPQFQQWKKPKKTKTAYEQQQRSSAMRCNHYNPEEYDDIRWPCRRRGRARREVHAPCTWSTFLLGYLRGCRRSGERTLSILWERHDFMSSPSMTKKLTLHKSQFPCTREFVYIQTPFLIKLFLFFVMNHYFKILFTPRY